MQNFDREIQSLIFPGNKATDQNKFDNCEELKTPEPNCWRNVFVLTCTWRYCMSKTAINADVSTSEKLRSAISQ